MKTKIFTLAIFSFLFAGSLQAQDVTTVNAKNSDISDNLDLRAVASIFGDSKDLEDFERRLNNQKEPISNLDLNGDGRVDYLRVIETVDNGTHLIVIQSVLEKDVFQDVATVEVERDANNDVQVQVVGDVYMYGPNYIYEPVYVTRPIIYTHFWTGYYHPYYSPYYYGYYPVYYSYWEPYPIFRYRRNINIYINDNNHYNYVNVRRSQRAIALYSTRRANGYERSHPNRSFRERNNNVTNHYELEQKRTAVTSGTPRGGKSQTPGRNSTTAAPTRNNVKGKNDAPTRNAVSNNTVAPTRNNVKSNDLPTRNATVNPNAAPVRTSVKTKTTTVTNSSTSNSVRTTAPVKSANTQISTPRSYDAPVKTSVSTQAPARNNTVPGTRIETRTEQKSVAQPRSQNSSPRNTGNPGAQRGNGGNGGGRGGRG